MSFHENDVERDLRQVRAHRSASRQKEIGELYNHNCPHTHNEQARGLLLPCGDPPDLQQIIIHIDYFINHVDIDPDDRLFNVNVARRLNY